MLVLRARKMSNTAAGTPGKLVLRIFLSIRTIDCVIQHSENAGGKVLGVPGQPVLYMETLYVCKNSDDDICNIKTAILARRW